MNKKVKKQLSTKKYSDSIMMILPLMLICIIVPLIVRLKLAPLSEATKALSPNQNVNPDFFSYYKMVWFLIFSGIGIGIFAIKYLTEENMGIKKTNLYIPMGIYSFFVILSMVFSNYKDIAKLGYIDRYEGGIVLLAYMACLFLAINLINTEKQIKGILFSIGISSIVISIIGIFQFVGLDLFASDFGKNLIIPSKYLEFIESLNFVFNERKVIYGTLFNPNYVGVYMAMLFSLSCTILFLAENKLIKLFFGIVSLLSFINLLGSGSRTGMLSIILYIILILIFFRTKLFKKWKYILTMLIAIVLILYGVNYYTEGIFKARIINIKNSLVANEDNDFKDVILKDNRAKIVLKDYELNIEYGNGNIRFYDKNDNEIEPTMKENRITFNGEPYNGHFIDLAIHKNNYVFMTHIRSNKGWMNFNLIVDENEDIKFMNLKGEPVDLVRAPSWGFEGRERFASNRGYIWSRSIPMLKNTIFLGYGPDTYALQFPQDDYIEKLRATGMTNLIVDKPHNYYLQIGINTGVVSLISILVLFCLYIKSSIQVYIKRKAYSKFIEVAGISIFFSICNYLMMGLLNDSVVSIAPVFWILLGTGASINMILKKEGELNN